MTTLYERAIESAFKMARRVNGTTISYVPAAGDPVEVVALLGSTVHALEIGDVATQYTSRDYLILASELLVEGLEHTPARGDAIAVGGKTRPVLSLNGEPGWRPNDQFGVVLRVHTKDA